MMIRLKIEPERELDLALGSQSDVFADRRIEHAEGGSRGCRGERLPGLKLIGAGSQRVAQYRRRIREIGVIQNVVELSSKLDVSLFIDREALMRGEVKLVHTGAVESIPAQIAEAPRLRNRERRRVQEVTAVRGLNEGIDARHNIGPAVAAERSAERIVDHRGGLRR